MGDIPLAPVLRYLRQLAQPRAIEGPSDAVLLEQLAAHGDSAAFEVLVRRHGRLVWRVCRRVLYRQQDAEDAFQATFLALGRQAGSIRKAASLSSFLHSTAYRIARRAQEHNRRQAVPPDRLPAPAPDPGQQAAWRELGRLVEEEVHALPEGLRAALLLCYWEGLTNEEAARRLGCPCGTLKTRLARARKVLHDRLTRRGVTLSAGVTILLLAPSGAEASVPPALAAAVQAMIAAGVSGRVAALAAGGLRSMTLTRVTIGLVLLAVGTVAAGMSAWGHRAPVAGQPPVAAGKEDGNPGRPQPARDDAKARADLHGDPLPERALARLGTVRWRMGGLFFACAYSPDGKTLAAASGDHDVYLFDAAAGKLLRRLRGHQSEVTCIAFAPDGRTLASGCAREGTIRIWEADTGKGLRQFQTPRWPVYSLIFSRNGKSIFSGGFNFPILVWDATTGKEVRRFSGTEEGLRCLALSPDGRTLASSAPNDNGQVQLWEAATGKPIRRLAGQGKPVRALAFSPDGMLLAAGDEDGFVWLWETAHGKVRRRLPDDAKELPRPGTASVRALAFAPDGKSLVVGAGDYSLRFWDVAAGKKTREMPGIGSICFTPFQDGGIQCVAFSPDGRRLAFGQDHRLTLLDARSAEEVSRFEGHGGGVKKVFFGPKGEHLITANSDPSRPILEWESTSGRLIREAPGRCISPHLVCFSPDRTIEASASGTMLHLRDAGTGKDVRQVPLPFRPAATSPNDVSFSPDGKLLAVVAGLGREVCLLDAATGKQLWRGEESTTDWAYVLARFSPDGRCLAVVGNEAIRLVEIPSGRHLLHVSLAKNRVSFAADLSPDGRTLALASGEWVTDPALPVFAPPAPGLAVGPSGILKVRAITLWETATGKERLAIPSPSGRVNSLLFSPDGRFLALGGDDQTVHLGDPATGEWVRRLEGHQGEVKGLAFSPDCRRLASGSLDTTALVWDLTGLARQQRRPGPPDSQQFEALWSALGGADASKAYRAILALEMLPKRAVPLLAGHLRRPGPHAGRIAGLLEQLDSEDFALRQRAADELRKLHWNAEPALRKKLEETTSLEVRKRTKELLGELFTTAPPPDLLQDWRAVEVLERIGTPEAQGVLRELAGRAPATRLTREARAALERLGRPVDVRP